MPALNLVYLQAGNLRSKNKPDMTVNKSDNSRLNILEIQLQSNTLAFIVLCERSQIKLLYHDHIRSSFYKNKSKYGAFFVLIIEDQKIILA